MSFTIADRVKETSTTTGTGNITLAGAVTGFRTFNSAISVSSQTFYAIVHRTANEWEVGIGTLSGATTLTRDQVYSSSNSGSAVNFSAGTKDVFVTQPAEKQLDPFAGYTFLPDAYEISTGNFYRTIQAQQGTGGTSRISFNNTYDGSSTFSNLNIGSDAESATSAYLDVTAARDTSGNRSVSVQLSTSGVLSSFGGTGYLFKTSANQLGLTTVSNQAGTSCFVFIGYDTVPTFTDWSPFGSSSPVTPGTVIVGNAATSPTFYRYDGVSWAAMGGSSGGGVTQIIAGTGITITSTGPSGTGAVTINASGGPGGMNWATYQDNDMSMASLNLATPSATPSGGMVPPLYMFSPMASPPPPWNFSGSPGGGIGSTYSNSSYPITSPITGPSFSGPAVCYYIGREADAGATDTFPVNTGSSPYTNFSSNLFSGSGWPVFGSTRTGHYIGIIQGSYLGGFAGVSGATLVDEFYDSWNNYTYYFINCDASLVSSMSGGTPIGTFGGFASYSAYFWYTYS